MRLKSLLLSLCCVLMVSTSALAKTEIDFMFPVHLQGKVAQEVMRITKEFNASQKDIEVTAIFTGDYDSTRMKASAAQKAGKAPSVVITAANNVSDLVITDSIIPMKEVLATVDLDADTYLDEFWPALHINAVINDAVYAIPYQNSTPVLYYNKTMFEKAGLEVPQTWADVVAAGKKLTNAEENTWGIMMPTTNNDYCGWILSSLTFANGGNFYNAEYPGEVYYDSASTIGALEFWKNLVFKHKIMPKGVLDANGISTAFFEQKLGMAFLSTGALTFMRENSKDFELGVAFMPKNVRRGVAIGGASLVVYRGISEEQKKAAATFITYLMQPERAGAWSRFTGYFSPRIKAYDLPEMQEFLKQNPTAKVGVDQLKYARGWFNMYDTIPVRRALENRVQRMVNEESYDARTCAVEAQKEANELLLPYQKKTSLMVP